jgi:hypothetical protein
MHEAVKPVTSLGEFIGKVTGMRDHWGLPNHKELWFRGEGKDYGETALRPELYRPTRPGATLKPNWQLLRIEDDLHNEFRRNALVRSDEKISEDD